MLPAVLDGIGFRRGVLLGHSDGATIAALYGGLSGDLRVRGLVLIAPHFFTEPEGLQAIADARLQYQTGNLRQRLGKYHADVDCAFTGWNDAWLDPEFRDWNVTDAIDHLRIPVLAIQGREDAYGTLAQIEEIENRIYSPLETELLSGCGHAPHLEQESKTLQAVTGFVDRLNRIEAVEVALSLKSSQLPMPPHAHVPGQNDRPAEGFFDFVEAHAADTRQLRRLTSTTSPGRTPSICSTGAFTGKPMKCWKPCGCELHKTAGNECSCRE